MKEELIKILNNKLDDINGDIDSLVELNNKITSEEDNVAYISQILDIFKNNHETNIMKFPELAKDDFNKVLDILDGDVKTAFASNSCNYDGLVYLIKGINEGVSLALTDEQKNAIEYLIQKLGEKEEEYHVAIEGYKLVKDRYLISDVDALKAKKENYLTTLEELDKKEYVNDTDLLMEAMNFSEVSNEQVIDILKYLLEYNAEVHETHPVSSESAFFEAENNIDDNKDAYVEEKNDVSVDNKDTYVEEQNNDNIIHQELEEDSGNNMFNFDSLNTVNDNEYSEPVSINFDANEELNDMPTTDYQEFHFNDIVKDTINDTMEDSNYDMPEPENTGDEVTYPEEVKVDNNIEENPVGEIQENNLYSDNDSDYFEENNERVSTGDLQTLLGNFDVDMENTYLNELVVGDIKNYESVLNTIKDHNLIENFKNNRELLDEVLLYSDSDSIERVLKIIKEDLSVDDDDFVITTKIAIDTIPSVFVKHEGNYDNFIKNVDVFKELELNLINLFDFSKELFVANNNRILDNLEIVKKYDVEITYQNAKYLLLLTDIGDRLDYYIESVYPDKEKNEVFDGLEYINLYTAKLNVVTDETIKRLRYSSENGKKVFGNKPKSLVGEITNLKVNSLDISEDYLSKFFNNEFTMLTSDEVREYIKLIHSSSNVGNYNDELDFLEKFHDGSRYIIENINISYNKVLRNYSILRSYGIDSKKALHFAVCYNLVITKEEYEKLKGVLDELGGNL